METVLDRGLIEAFVKNAKSGRKTDIAILQQAVKLVEMGIFPFDTQEAFRKEVASWFDAGFNTHFRTEKWQKFIGTKTAENRALYDRINGLRRSVVKRSCSYAFEQGKFPEIPEAELPAPEPMTAEQIQRKAESTLENLRAGMDDNTISAILQIMAEIIKAEPKEATEAAA